MSEPLRYWAFTRATNSALKALPISSADTALIRLISSVGKFQALTLNLILILLSFWEMGFRLVVISAPIMFYLWWFKTCKWCTNSSWQFRSVRLSPQQLVNRKSAILLITFQPVSMSCWLNEASPVQFVIRTSAKVVAVYENGSNKLILQPHLCKLWMAIELISLNVDVIVEFLGATTNLYLWWRFPTSTSH